MKCLFDRIWFDFEHENWKRVADQVEDQSDQSVGDQLWDSFIEELALSEQMTTTILDNQIDQDLND